MHRTDEQVDSAEAQAAKLRGVLESAVIAIIRVGDRGLIESVNPASERLFGYSAAEFVSERSYHWCLRHVAADTWRTDQFVNVARPRFVGDMC
jgi:PAS domain-containing protein